MKFTRLMTPYAHAVDLFQRGSSVDEVVKQLVATGLAVGDARTAALAAKGKIMASVTADEAAAPEPQPEPQPFAVSGAEPVKAGFHGWLLVACILLGVLSVLSMVGVATTGLLLPWAIKMMNAEEIACASFKLLAAIADAALLITGGVLLLQRKRRALSVLVAWGWAWSAWSLANALFGDGRVASIVVPLLWLVYFNTSKQLQATLTR